VKNSKILWFGGVALVIVVAGGYLFSVHNQRALPADQLIISTSTEIGSTQNATDTVVLELTTSTQAVSPVHTSTTIAASKLAATSSAVISKKSDPPAVSASKSVVPTTTVATSTIAIVPSMPQKISGTLTSRELRVAAAYIWTATTTDARWPAVAEPTNRAINPKAVVALLCHDYDGGLWKGSGNIINPKGYILTNRHVAVDAKYCEVAMPDDTILLPTRAQLADMTGVKPVVDVTGWRPYKAVKLFAPPQDGLSEGEQFEVDFALMKISEINDDCELFNRCGALPTSFPYNPISNLHIPTSTAPEGFPFDLQTGFYIPQQPYELLSYGYPAEGSGGGLSHVLRGNLGYAIGYLPGDKKFTGDPISLLNRTLYSTYGGASGSGVFYRGHIIGLVHASFIDLQSVQFVVPMPLITQVLKENAMDWVLATE
jgi:hypothetical protein